ncbi:MAG: hypothetical protein SPG61_03960, partial [Arcanobacterium sp.]|nr:hypothetical protein [Arcanobacterium sp.]
MSAIDYGTYRSQAVIENPRVRFAVVEPEEKNLAEVEIRSGGSRAVPVQRSLVRPDRPRSRRGVSFGIVDTPFSAVSPDSVLVPSQKSKNLKISTRSGGVAAANKEIGATGSSRSATNVAALESQLLFAIKLLAILVMLFAMFTIGLNLAGYFSYGTELAS